MTDQEEPRAVLNSGWTISAPPGTPQEVVDFIAGELDYEGVRTIEDITREVMEHLTREHAGPTLAAPERMEAKLTEMGDHIASLFRAMNQDLVARMDFHPVPMPQFHPKWDPERGEPEWFTTNPSGTESWAKRRFVDTTQPTEYRWQVTVDPAGEWDALLLPGPYDQVDDSTAELCLRWAMRPPARPGWRGNIMGRPREVEQPETPWKSMGGLIIEPGADNNPNARLTKLDGTDLGPAFPNGLRPAYRGTPAPLPWSHPDADPIADMKRAIEEDQ